MKNFISTTEKLSDAEKDLLLILLGILESPGQETNEKIEELEIQLTKISPE